MLAPICPTGLGRRLPIGRFFSVLGLILAGYGFVTAGDTAHYTRSLRFNINLWWGLIMLASRLGLLRERRAGLER